MTIKEKTEAVAEQKLIKKRRRMKLCPVKSDQKNAKGKPMNKLITLPKPFIFRSPSRSRREEKTEDRIVIPKRVLN